MPRKKPILHEKTKINDCVIHLHGFSHTPKRKERFVKGKIAVPELIRPLEKAELVLHEKNIQQLIPSKKNAKLMNIEMKKRDEWRNITKMLKKVEGNTMKKVREEEAERAYKNIIKGLDSMNRKEKREFKKLLSDKKHEDAAKMLKKFSPSVATPYLRVYAKTEAIKNHVKTLKKKHSSLSEKAKEKALLASVSFGLEGMKKEEIAIAYPYLLEQPVVTANNLRDAYMAEKISLLADKKPELHVVTGSGHTHNIKRFIEDPKLRKKVIEHFKELTPVSYTELKEWKKKHK